MKKRAKVIAFLKDNSVMINSLMCKSERDCLGNVVDRIINELQREDRSAVQGRFLIRKDISSISKVFFDKKKGCLILQIICDSFPLEDAYELHPCIREYRYDGKVLKGYYAENDDNRIANIMGVMFTDDGRVIRGMSASWQDYTRLLKVLDEMYRQVQQKNIVLPDYIRL